MADAKNEYSGKKILLVEDDELFRSALQSSIRNLGLTVTVCNNGKAAQNLVGLESFDVVISDINMPEGSGIELLHFVKRSKPSLPVVLMTGFAELKETEEANSLGAAGFLAKPFKKEDLENIIRLCLKIEDKPVDEDSDDQFCKISIDDFVSGREIKYDVFIRLSASKYVKVAHQGEDLPLERVRSYKSKNILFLYLRKPDFEKYIGLNMSIANAIRANKNIDKTKKIAFLKHTSDVIMESVFVNGVDQKDFENAKTIVESTASLISEDNDMLNLLNILNGHADFLYAHSLGVSLYGVMIAKAMKWTSQTSFYKISIGGLFHDIGKKEISVEILRKNRREMTAPEVEKYESHPMRGMDILMHMPTVPEDIAQIAAQHHEDCMGLGFPMHLTKNKIHPMARVIAVANAFCNLALKNPNSPAGMPPHDAIKRMLVIHADKLDPQPLLALMGIFKFEPPKEIAAHQKD